jgi:ribosomal protein S25
VVTMGGQKKRNISQMDKAQQIQEKKSDEDKKAKTRRPATDIKRRGVDLPNLNDEKLISEIKKLKVLTPYAVSSQLNVKISLAKALLRELENKNIIKPIEGNSRIRIYQVAA